MIFCCFWSVAINIVYKLQFLTSIFTVLLPGLSTSSLYSFRKFRRGSWKLSELAAPWMITVLSLCVVVDPDTFSSLFHHFMHRNGCVSTYSSTSAISVVLSKVSFMLRVEIVVIWQHTRQFLSTLSLCMCRTAIFWVSNQNSDTNVQFGDPSFLKRICFQSKIWCYHLSGHCQFHVKRLKFWQFGNISGNFWPYFHCTCTEMAKWFKDIFGCFLIV